MYEGFCFMHLKILQRLSYIHSRRSVSWKTLSYANVQIDGLLRDDGRRYFLSSRQDSLILDLIPKQMLQ